MKAALLPCSLCGAAGVRNYSDTGWCHACLTRIDSYLFGDADIMATGHGWQYGLLRPDWGPLFADLRCSCGCTWVGPIGEECTSCAGVAQRHQDQLLAGPLVDETPRSWTLRLAHSVKAGVLTDADARAVIARFERRQQRAA